MPLAGIPMIDYTIRFLRYNQVKDIIIFTAQNKKLIEEYFKADKKDSKNKTKGISVISGEQCKR